MAGPGISFSFVVGSGVCVLHSYRFDTFENSVTAAVGSWIRIGAAGKTGLHSLSSLEAVELSVLRSLSLPVT